MNLTEAALKQNIKDGPAGVYVLYGEELYLTEQYARLIARKTVDEAYDAFNRQVFDGQTVTLEQLGEAVEALPLMSDRKCVLVRDMDIATADTQRLLALIADVPAECVLIFCQLTVQPDKKKSWQQFLRQAETVGQVVCFDRKTPEQVAKMLVSGAAKRGCELSIPDALYMVEQAGNDLTLLLNELEKLVAAADGTITRELIDTLGTKNLEARVFDLSKAILRRQAAQAYRLLHQLFVQREESLAILGVLSNSYADLYRAKVASAGGIKAAELASSFPSYKGKEFRLRNAAGDSARMSVETLRNSLEILAKADRSIKTGRADDRTVLEETVAALMEQVKT